MRYVKTTILLTYGTLRKIQAGSLLMGIAKGKSTKDFQNVHSQKHKIQWFLLGTLKFPTEALLGLLD